MRSVSHRLAPGGQTLCCGLWSAGIRPHHARLLKKIISFQLYNQHCEIIPALEALKPERFIFPALGRAEFDP